MICPNYQAKFNGFCMGKVREQHIIKCGNCDSFLIPSNDSFQSLTQKKKITMTSIGLAYFIIVYIGARLLIDMSDWYFYAMIIIGAIAASKLYVDLFKRHYTRIISFQPYIIKEKND